MKYKLESEFRSLKPFQTEELPEFVILTGINGVGKTQILQAAVNGHSNIVTDGVLTPPHKIKYIEKLLPVSDLNPIHRDYGNYPHHHEEDPLFIGYSRIFEFQDQHQKLPENLEELEKFTNSIYGNINLGTKQFQKLKSFIEKSPKRITDPKLLKESIPHGYHPTTHDIFSHNFSTIFYNYQKLEFENLFNEFLKERKNKSVSYLNQNDFIKKYGNPPWKVINGILDSVQIAYEFKVPHEDDYSPYLPYDPKFVKKGIGTEVKISELSSGEKILIALAFALYNNDHVTQLPKILLLDETDASLHPSMSKQYLNILKDVFVKDLGIKVIITTHSPSTVALADESDIYVVENSEQRIRKCSKDEALSVLTAGVPSLSINYENRKQVFVESPYDVKYYDAIYKILNPYLNKEISLNFISSGDSRTDENGDPIANCSQVKNITQTMRKYGNKSCFGIIDWDLKNQDNQDGIFVNAFNQQYSVENCLLNPLFLGLLILALKTGSQNDISHRYVDLNHHSVECLQEIHDWILKKIEVQFPNKNQNQTSVYLTNGVKISTPEWFTHHQGHELESKILNQIPELKKIKQNKEEKLKLEIINKVFDDFPQLVPTYFKDVFIKIQAS